jgi:ribosomal protein L40E
MRFQGKNKDLNQLSQQIVEQLTSEGYKTQSTIAPLGLVVQAQKAGILRDIITADRAFTILITGQPNDFSIHIGIGKWVQNLAVMAAETLFLSWLFLAIDVPEMLWTQHVENVIANEITQIVEASPAASTTQAKKYCTSCGGEIPANAFYCPKCGQKQPN